MENKETNQSKQVEYYTSWLLLIIIFIGSFLVLKPFLSAAIWAVILAFSLWPANRRFVKLLGNRRTLAAMITTLTLSILLVVPFIILGVNLADDISAVGAAAVKWSAEGPKEAPAWLEKIPLVGSHAKKYWQQISQETSQFAQRLSVAAEQSPPLPPDANDRQSAAAENSKFTKMFAKLIISGSSLLKKVAVVMGKGILQVVLSLLLTFIFLREVSLGDRLAAAVTRIAGQRGLYLLNVAGDTVRKVIYGILGTALVQGVLAGIGFAIAGVPGPAFLALLTFFLSSVPMGPPLVWIPAVIWLFANGESGWGIFMIIWGIAVSSIDNIVKPWLISKGGHLPFILTFFGVIGGALAFGAIGIFIGPCLLALAYCLINEWLG